MALAGITIVSNVLGQVMLIRDGGWVELKAAKLQATPVDAGVQISSGNMVLGMAPKSSLAALAAGSEFFLGEVRQGMAQEVGGVMLTVIHPPLEEPTAGLGR